MLDDIFALLSAIEHKAFSCPELAVLIYFRPFEYYQLLLTPESERSTPMHQ
jgi:hypothetical protein